MTAVRIILVTCAFVLAGWVPTSAHATSLSCGAGVNFTLATQTCQVAPTDAHTMVNAAAAEHHQYSFAPNCHDGAGTCSETPTCPVDDNGTQGEDMIMYQDGVAIGETCWSDTDTDTTTQPPTPGQVMDAARNLTWPQATLVIQPPNGETLVNFDTNFYTTTTAATTQQVTLLTFAVTIEATPASYTWRFGDDATLTSEGPGRAYPHLDITHRYLRKGTVKPQVDVTYRGRFRIADGDWQDLPDTLTVTGQPQDLRILTATPHLVGS